MAFAHGFRVIVVGRTNRVEPAGGVVKAFADSLVFAPSRIRYHCFNRGECHASPPQKPSE